MFCTGLQPGSRLLLAAGLYLPESSRENDFPVLLMGKSPSGWTEPAKTPAAFSEIISVELNVPSPPECLYLW